MTKKKKKNKGKNEKHIRIKATQTPEGMVNFVKALAFGATFLALLEGSKITGGVHRLGVKKEEEKAKE